MQVCGVHNTNNDIFVITSACLLLDRESWGHIDKHNYFDHVVHVEEGIVNRLTMTSPTPSIDSNH